jgi:mRNA interferase MazF
LVISSDRFNASRLATTLIAAATSNLRLASAPGNVPLPDTLLPQPSVVNVTQLLAIDRSLFDAHIGDLPVRELRAVDCGLRLVLDP